MLCGGAVRYHGGAFLEFVVGNIVAFGVARRSLASPLALEPAAAAASIL